MKEEFSIGNDVTMRESASDALAVIDQFEILRKLGGGGFGSVYLARDTVAGIEVAVKGLPPVVRNNTEELERIRSNFALVSRLHHPYIAAALHLHRVQSADYRVNGVYEELNVGPGDTLMVMEYAPGVTLSQWRKQFPDGKVPLEVAVNLVYQVAMALDYSHAHQVLHRDVKPSNIMVETQNDGSVVARVLDFGLAAEIKSSMGRVSMEIHDTSGTRPYMAPEQWAGRKQGPATDQYALACLFCELVSGEVPFASVFETGDPMVMMTAVCNREVELPADCPRRHALKKALSKDPKDRYATCAEFVENLAKSEGRFDAERGEGLQLADGAADAQTPCASTEGEASSEDLRRTPDVMPRTRPNRLSIAVVALIALVALGGVATLWLSTLGKERAEKARVAHLVADAQRDVRRTVESVRRQTERIEADTAERLAKAEAWAGEAAEAKRRREDSERQAELEAKKAEDLRIAAERKLELERLKLEQHREEEVRRKSEEEAKLEAEKRLEAAKRICKQCHGSGIVWSRAPCCKCNGTQYVEVAIQCKLCQGEGERMAKVNCPNCNGKGKVHENCSSCHGKGTVVCSACNGTGGSLCRQYVPGIGGHNRALRKVKVNCSCCNGSGRVRCWNCNGGTLVNCPHCDGRGVVRRDGSCKACKGTGVVHAKERCRDCEDGYAYVQKSCGSCLGVGKRLLVGDEKPDPFDGISLRMPVKTEYLQISFKSALMTPQGCRAQFLAPKTGGGNEEYTVSTGDEIGSTGWMLKSYDQNITRREVPGVSGMFRNVDVSTASLVRPKDGKIVKLQIGAAPGQTPIDIKATLIVCGLDGGKDALVVTEGKSFRLEGNRFVVKEITMSSVTVEESSTGRKKVIRPEYSQSI